MPTGLTPAEERRRLVLVVTRSLDMAEQALALLDDLDGDPDAEPDDDGEEAHEGCCDAADDDLSSHPCRLHSGPVAGPGTPEDEEPDADGEASLGWPEAPGRMVNRLDQSMNHLGAGVDAYRADLEHDTADAEPSLGWETDGHQGCGALASGYDNTGRDREGGVGPIRRRPFVMPGEFKPQLPPVWLPVRHPALPAR